MFFSGQGHPLSPPQQQQSLFGSSNQLPLMQTSAPAGALPAFGSTWGTTTISSNRLSHPNPFGGGSSANPWANATNGIPWSGGGFGQAQPPPMQQQQQLIPMRAGGACGLFPPESPIPFGAAVPFGHAPIKQGAAFAATAAAAVPTAKRAFGERKTSLDNAHLFGGFSSPSRSGSGGNGRRQQQHRRRSKKSADGRLSDSRTDSASSPPASDVAAPRFTRNFDHLRLLLDAFQAESAASGCERSESATTTNAAAADQRAPLMVLHDILHLH